MDFIVFYGVFIVLYCFLMQIENSHYEEAMDAKTEIAERLHLLVTSLSDGFGINLPNNNNNGDTVSIPKTLIQNIQEDFFKSAEALKVYMK